MTTEWEEVTVKSETKTITLSITQQHIDDARHRIRLGQASIFNDPISLALKEAVKAKWAMTGWGYARTGHDNNIHKDWNLFPQKTVKNFMLDFDYGKKVSPLVINAYQEKEIDKTPRPITRRMPRRKNFADAQQELGLK